MTSLLYTHVVLEREGVGTLLLRYKRTQLIKALLGTRVPEIWFTPALSGAKAHRVPSLAVTMQIGEAESAFEAMAILRAADPV